MAELQKLLTFMYEEDMQKVLSMYSALFGDASNEAILLDYLGSPTRQAVMLARVYNAKERKLQINSTSRLSDDTDEEGGAEFIEAMNRLRSEAEKRGIVYGDEQFGFAYAESAEPTVHESRVWGERKEEAVPDREEAQSAEPPKTDGGENEKQPEPEAKVESVPAAPEKPEERIAETVEEKHQEKPEEKKGEANAVHVSDEDIRFDFSAKADTQMRRGEPVETVKKTNVFLAIIYCIFAVPLTIAISVVLLIPAFAALALAAVGAYVSFKLITSAFGSFAIFADIMVVLGAGLVTAALGLLFLWTFVWFIGGAIAGVISGAIRLGEKLCVREVPVK